MRWRCRFSLRALLSDCKKNFDGPGIVFAISEAIIISLQAARKPNSVLDDHSSRRRITAALQQPTRRFRLSFESLRLGASGRYAHRRVERSGEIPAYLVLLRVGFTVPRSLLAARCALTAPFHPYAEPLADLPKQITNLGRYILCCTGRPAALTRPSRTLSGTLPCGVRTFLPRLTPWGRSSRVKTAAIIQPPALSVYRRRVSRGANKTASNCVEESRLSLAFEGSGW